MKIYITNVSRFADLPGLELLDPVRRGKLGKYNISDDKLRCLAAGLLLRHALGEGLKDISYTQSQKPYLPNESYFNISHSGEYAVLAVSEHELGVDIEKNGEYKEKLAQRCCTEEELIFLHGSKDKSLFYKMWTGKESIMKATGEGFRMSPRSFSVLPLEDGGHNIFGKRWYMRWLDLPGYSFCVACAENEDVELIFPDKEELLA